MMTEDAELLVDCLHAVLGRHDPAAWRHDVDGFWHFVRPIGGSLPKQGWKLHVPATPLSACLVLSRCVSVLAEQRCAFKFTKSMRELQLLIEPNADRASAGKFLTAYPEDDAHALRIAAALHEATMGLPGQQIVTDRRFRPNSLVFYRYGGFTPDLVLTDDGEYVPVLHDGTGTPVVDRRPVGRPVPEWLPDPFQATVVEAPSVPRSVLVGGRYQVRSAIRQSNRGGVYLATDTATGTDVILKRFRLHTAAAVDQTDSRNRARAEARMLDALGPARVSPKFLDLLNENGDMFVAQERIDGVPLRRFVSRHLRPTPGGALAMDTSLVRNLAGQLVDLLAEVHAAGYVLGDLTPNNVLVTPENRLVLIDLESALREWEVTVRLTTKSYTAPEEAARTRLVAPAPRVSADLYGLGATLLYLASGAHPPAAAGGRAVDVVERTALRNPAVAALRPVITALLADDPDDRPALPAVRAALLAPVAPVPTVAAPPAADELVADMLAAIQDTMTPDAPWLWRPTSAGSRYDPCSVQLGAPGVLAVLNQAMRAGYPVESTVDITARWIAERLADEPRVLPGLLFGRAGTALTLVETGELLGDAALRAAGLALARRLPTTWPVPDVFHGVAGAGIALLRLWRSTGEPDLLERAIACADHVLAVARFSGEDVRWTATGDSALAGEIHWGFAHGVAGIGTFLLELASVTDDHRCREIVDRCARTLAGAVDRDGAAGFWPGGPVPDDRADTVRLTGLCNGSSGVGTFLLRYFAATGDGVARELAEAAAVAVRCANWTSHPVWCHGLASDGDFLLDCADVLAQSRYRDWAADTADVLAARAVPRGGRLLTPDEGGEVVAAFGNGYAGPLSFLLRLRHGGDRPLIGAPATAVPGEPRPLRYA